MQIGPVRKSQEVSARCIWPALEQIVRQGLDYCRNFLTLGSSVLARSPAPILTITDLRDDSWPCRVNEPNKARSLGPDHHNEDDNSDSSNDDHREPHGFRLGSGHETSEHGGPLLHLILGI